MKKTLLSLTSAAALLGAFAAPAIAASTFHLVVPLGARTQVQEPGEAITVSLTGAALPKAKVNQAYSESLRPYLSVTGDTAFDAGAARWSLVDGALPAGLALNATTGEVAGKPATKTSSPASFTILATYKGKTGPAVYTIEVGGDLLQVSSIAAGARHSCGITPGGGVKCWGSNSNGQLGDNTTTQRLTPVDVVGLGSGVASIYAGAYHTCAVTTAGAAVCWGRNLEGQLGDGTTVDRWIPVAVAGLNSGIASMATMNVHTCAVTTSGAAKCWGNNGNGRLGDNTTTSRLTPVDVFGLDSGVADITAGNFHTCAVLTTGAAKCWGRNSNGQIGDESTTQRNAPVDVAGLGVGVASIAAGANHTCAVMNSGAAKCWGYNVTGQVGDGSGTQRISPVDVVGLSGVVRITGGTSHTCALMASGAAKCWGDNAFGQVGDNSTTNRVTPVDVPGLSSGVASIKAAGSHTCAVLTSGAPMCWGYNVYGQVGDNSTADRYTPVAVQGFQ